MKWRVAKQEGGTTLLSFLKAHCAEAPSVKALKRAIDHKQCTVNGTLQTFSSFLLEEGDLVVLHVGDFDTKKPLIVTILYEDDDLRLIHKPAGLLSDVNALQQKGCHLVHRLDKETSGVLLLAKTSAVKQSLQALFKQRAVQKLYLAIVDGVVEKEEGMIDNYLGKKGSYAGQTVYGAVPAQKGLRAITYWRCLSRGKAASLLSCEPHTGRTHQLRVHLSGMGHPILGDRQYAQRFRCGFHPARNLLHAYRLTMTHPRTGQLLKITAPIPHDFKEALQRLHLDVKP